jgi:uncharacterized protein (DUF362 family)
MAVLLNDGQKNLKEAFRHILDTFLKDMDCSRGIFIKPNIVFPVKPESGEITSPLIVRTLIEALRERSGNIDIILGEGVAAGCDPKENFKVSGYADLAQELNVPLLDLHCAESRTVVWKFGHLKLPKVAFDRIYINLPILKPSSACVISGALKNQKGLLLPVAKKNFHRLGLHEQVAELYRVVQPVLTIMDCSLFFGRNILISGNNCGEIDATACHLLGIKEPEHLRLARSAGLFSEGYSIEGEIDIKPIAARPVVKEFKRLGRLRLWSNPQACTMCRYLFHEIQEDFIEPKNLRGKAKLISHSIKGTEIIMGLNPRFRKEYPSVICIGICTRRVAKEGGYIYIPGCPPTLNDLYNNLP